MKTGVSAFDSAHQLGEPATRLIVRFLSWLAALFLLARPRPGASSRLAIQLKNRTLKRVQLSFLG